MQWFALRRHSEGRCRSGPRSLLLRHSESRLLARAVGSERPRQTSTVNSPAPPCDPFVCHPDPAKREKDHGTRVSHSFGIDHFNLNRFRHFRTTTAAVQSSDDQMVNIVIRIIPHSIQEIARFLYRYSRLTLLSKGPTIRAIERELARISTNHFDTVDRTCTQGTMSAFFCGD